MSRRWSLSKIERTVFPAAVALISCLAPPADSQDRDRALTKDQAALKINLRKYDFHASSIDARLPIFVDFTDSNHIAMAWQTYDHPAEARRTKFFDAVAVHLHVLVLDTIAGKKEALLLQARLPENGRFGPAARASANGRFATAEQRMRGVTSDFWDLSAFPADDRVVVFDLVRRQAIFAVKVDGNSPWPPFHQHKNRIALSQNGDLLAILSDEVLNIYPLPKIQ
jgi:hypothetical protein